MKLPWRLGKNQLAVVEHLVDLNNFIVAEYSRPFNKMTMDWSKGGAGVTTNSLASLCGFWNYSQATTLLERLADRGIIERAKMNSLWHFTQIALKELGYIK